MYACIHVLNLDILPASDSKTIYTTSTTATPLSHMFSRCPPIFFSKEAYGLNHNRPVPVGPRANPLTRQEAAVCELVVVDKLSQGDATLFLGCVSGDIVPGNSFN